MSTDGRMPCPVCGEQISEKARKCRFCGEEFDKDESGEEKEGDATGGLIPYKNVPALVAYYCGLFSLFPCFILGWVAFIAGIKGLQKVKREPHVKGTVHAWIGVVMGFIFGLLWTGLTLVGVIAAIAGARR